ncbi:MAG: pitrilysin family protein [Planctomycetota bacterium]
MASIHRTQLPNGLTVVAEPTPGVRSLAMTLLLPAGLASQPADRQGVAPLLAEMACRGAGGRDARAHCDALDRLGVQRSTEAQRRFLRLGALMMSPNAGETLPLLFDMVRAPSLEDAALGPSVDLAVQAIDALDDEPQRRVMLELGTRHFPEPMGRSPLGVREHLEATTADDVRRFWSERFVAGGSILAFAGCFDWDELLATVTEQLGDWGGAAALAEPASDAAGGVGHVAGDSTQVHIAAAYPAVPLTDPRRVAQQAAVAVLSGGMSGRLFTEVREKRGLVYAVYAGYQGQKDRGDVLAYAGTTTPRAQETLDVMTAELRRLSEGVDESEFRRAVVGMKSRLVMQGESTRARAAAIASDVRVFGRPRSLAEAADEVDALTLDELNAFVADHPVGEMTVVTLGEQPLAVPA